MVSQQLGGAGLQGWTVLLILSDISSTTVEDLKTVELIHFSEFTYLLVQYAYFKERLLFLLFW